MALDFYCWRLLTVPVKQFHWFISPKNVLFYNIHLSQQFRTRLQKITPTMHCYCLTKVSSVTKNQMSMENPLLSSFQPYVYLGKMGLKYNTNHKRNFVKELKYKDIARGRRNEVSTVVQRMIQDKKNKFRQTEERWKHRGRNIIADIKETKSKLKEKVEEIVERENVWTVPNLLCASRIILSPFLGYLILDQDYRWALGVLTVAGITDLLDGWIARTFKGQSSKIGSFLDPMADKILVATMFVTLTYSGIIPVPLTTLIISRDIILVGAGFVIRYKSLPPPRTMSRYFDVTHATAQLAPTFISKVNTTVQLVTVACTLAAPVFGYLDHPALQGLWFLTAGTTVASAGSYLLTKNTFKFIRKRK